MGVDGKAMIDPVDSDRVIARGLTALGVATMVLTTWIWLRTGGLTPVLRDPLTPNLSEAYLTGLWSANLMVLQVLLMARLPWLERTWGRARLTRRHRLLGYWSFWLMVVHVYLFALQRVLRGTDAKGQALWDLFVTERWMLLATLGTLAILVVVLTSVQAAVRRLRYESWHLVHLWAYAGMALALPHELAAADFGVGWVAAYWWVLYAGGLLAVLWWRVAVPVLVSRRHDLRVASVVAGDDTVSVAVTGRDLAGLGARGGDFLTWRFLSGRGSLSGHPYSLSAAPSGSSLRLTVGTSSPEAARMAALPVGTRALVEGPYGDLPGLRRRHERLPAGRRRHRDHPAARAARGQHRTGHRAAPGLGRPRAAGGRAGRGRRRARRLAGRPRRAPALGVLVAAGGVRRRRGGRPRLAGPRAPRLRRGALRSSRLDRPRPLVPRRPGCPAARRPRRGLRVGGVRWGFTGYPAKPHTEPDISGAICGVSCVNR